MKKQETLYSEIVNEFIPNNNDSILVCGAGKSDSIVFEKLPFTNVTMCGKDLRPGLQGKFKMKHENAEKLSFKNNSFDYCVMHASIHHTRLPNNVICELYRVSRKGFLAIESRESLLIRLTQRLGITEEFEVKCNFSGSGVNGTDIPNYIFRWTERGVIKTIKCFDPCYNNEYLFKYNTIYPDATGIGVFKKTIIKCSTIFYKVLISFFPKQQNHFSFFVKKENSINKLHPWLQVNEDNGEVEVDRDYIKNTYLNR